MRPFHFLILILTAVFINSPVQAADLEAADKKWQQTLRDGVDALDTNRYWIAEPTLKSAVVEAGKFGIEDLRLAKSLGELGRLYTIRGRFDLAEPLLEEELHIKQEVLDEEGDQLVPAMGSMIKFYVNHGTKEKAEPLTNQMLEIVEGKIRETSNKPKTNVSKVDGKIVLEAWAGVAAQTAREPLLEWAITCDSVANAYFAEKKFDIAERLYKAALEVKETVYGKTHLSLANSYDSLGGLALAKNDLFTAESHLRDAYEMSSKILGKSNPVVYGRLDKLAKCLILAGKRAEAEQIYVAAQSLWKNAPSKTGDDIRACYALGNLYCEDKNYVAAEPLLKKAMVSAEEFYGPSSQSVVPYIQRYAYVLYYLGRKPESDEFKARASVINGGDFIAENSKASTESGSDAKILNKGL
ncbi:MAG: tetratricopeptide repeat protein [Candidatus Obscuribacterales bacterium]|nr:tetratricopeptide repeat protein [Candidatus Obscuribacterales bacterium]